MSFDKLYEGIPLDQAADYFIKLKYGSAQRRPSSSEILAVWDTLSEEEKVANTPSLEEYLAAEQEGLRAQEAAELSFLRGRSTDLSQHVQMQEQVGQDQSAQMAQMQQAMQQSNQQIQQALMQAAQAQQAQLQAQQAQLQAADEKLRTQQLAAQMRMSMQNMREQLLQLATQDPALSVGNELKGQSTEMGPQPGAPLPPSAVPVEGDSTTPQSNAATGQGEAETADAAPATNPTEQKIASTAGIAGAAGGALLGGALAMNEAKDGPQRHQKKIDQLEAGGGGGFINALQKAKAKAMLAYSEAAQQHPAAAGMMGAGMGAAMGYGTGEAVKNLVTKAK